MCVRNVAAGVGVRLPSLTAMADAVAIELHLSPLPFSQRALQRLALVSAT